MEQDNENTKSKDNDDRMCLKKCVEKISCWSKNCYKEELIQNC